MYKYSRVPERDRNSVPEDKETETMPEELWTKVHNIVQEVVTKTIPKKKKGNKAKRLSEEAILRKEAEKRRDTKGKGERKG